MTVGVTVSSTGSGPGVRLMVEVETPQPWRPSATYTAGTSARNSLLRVCFMDTAGKLTVQSLPAGAYKAPLGGDERKSAHDVARRPLRVRKEHTPAEWLDCVWDGKLGNHSPGLSYAS